MWHGINRWTCQLQGHVKAGRSQAGAARACAAGTGRGGGGWGGVEGAHTRRSTGPKAVSKPWRGWVEKKGVHLPLVAPSFLWVLVEVGAGVA